MISPPPALPLLFLVSFLSLGVAAVNQITADAITPWQNACQAAGGQDCFTPTQDSFTSLLANADPCAQQDVADGLVTFSKTNFPGNQDLITLAQIFRQQPRNSLNNGGTTPSVLYCQKAPKNAELNGLFQCQFKSCDPTVFGANNVAAGGAGTIPFGQTQVLSPAGSCPANPTGPLDDGVQLNTLVTNPGISTVSSNNGTSTSASASASKSKTSKTTSASMASSTSSISSDCDNDDGSVVTVTVTVTPTATSTKVARARGFKKIRARF